MEDLSAILNGCHYSIVLTTYSFDYSLPHPYLEGVRSHLLVTFTSPTLCDLATHLPKVKVPFFTLASNLTPQPTAFASYHDHGSTSSHDHDDYGSIS